MLADAELSAAGRAPPEICRRTRHASDTISQIVRPDRLSDSWRKHGQEGAATPEWR